jgi:hypothetical protein
VDVALFWFLLFVLVLYPVGYALLDGAKWLVKRGRRGR